VRRATTTTHHHPPPHLPLVCGAIRIFILVRGDHRHHRRDGIRWLEFFLGVSFTTVRVPSIFQAPVGGSSDAYTR